MSVRARHLIVGAIVVAAYVAVGLTAPFGPTRPLLDATAPTQPYQWVNPDPLFADGNKVPHNAELTVALDAAGSSTSSIITPDQQAGLVMPPGAFPGKAGETTINVLIEPLDPMTVGRPPSGQRFDSNAYRFSATYAKSKTPASLVKPANVVLRFPILATKIYRRDGDAWVELAGSTPLGAAQQVYAETPTLGTFVAASLPLETGEEKSFPTALVVSIAAAVLAAVAGVLARVRVVKRRRGPVRKTPPKRPPPKRPPPKRR